jgi:hypothetical protein
MALKFSILTRTNARKLQAGLKLHEHGITFERLANGDGRYSINIMVDSQRIHRVIGKESDGVTREQAEKFIEQARTDARQHRLNLPKGRKTILNFKDAAEKYLQKLEEEGGKDIPSKRQRLTQHLVPFFATMPLSKISTFDVERYKKKRLEQESLHGGDKIGKNGQTGTKVTPVTLGTVNRELAVLSHLLSKSVEWKWLDANPHKSSV